jgi:hypothetical protein
MSDVAPPRGMLRPPSERPAGKRGVRGTIAATVAIAGVLPLPFLNGPAETGWAEPAIVAASLALFGAAVLLWTAHRQVWIATAAAAVVAGGALAFTAITAEIRAHDRAIQATERWADASYSFPRARGAILTKAEARAVPKGLTREQLIKRFGEPSTRGVQHFRNRSDLRCVAYRRTDARPASQTLNAFCFRDGRYVELGEW